MSTTSSESAAPAPDQANTAVLVLDMISDFDFEDGEKLYPGALKAAKRLSGLMLRAKKANVPVIFVNDNFGNWKEDFNSYVRSVREKSSKGRKIVELVGPEEGDFHILKPQRSAFYATPLGVLLLTLNVSDLIITGVTTDICVLFSAHDAYMRGFRIHVPSDCTAAVEERYHESAIQLLERVVHANVGHGDQIEFTEQDVDLRPDGRARANGQKSGSEV